MSFKEEFRDAFRKEFEDFKSASKQELKDFFNAVADTPKHFKAGFVQALKDYYFILNVKGHYQRASAFFEKRRAKKAEEKLKL